MKLEDIKLMPYPQSACYHMSDVEELYDSQ